jgi:hypothetical protein
MSHTIKHLNPHPRGEQNNIHAPRTSLGARGFHKSKLPPRAGLICAPLIHLHSRVCNFQTRVITPPALFANTLGADRKIHTQLRKCDERSKREEEEAVLSSLCVPSSHQRALRRLARLTMAQVGRQVLINVQGLSVFLSHTRWLARSLSHTHTCIYVSMYIESGRALCGPLLRINKR